MGSMESLFNQPPSEPWPQSAEVALRTVRTVLLIDDSDDDEFFLRRSLAKAGIQANLIRIPGGREAIEYFSRVGAYADTVKYPESDLVFLDINMPSVSGFDVLAWLQTNRPLNAPFVVVLSSSEEFRDKDQAKKLGARGYATKSSSGNLFTDLAAELGLVWVKK
jgi:CheY-like chemotaxis protein